MKPLVIYRHDSGLGNRLRLHTAAAAYAWLHRGRLVAWWPRNAACGATFGDLFAAGAEDMGVQPGWRQLLYRFRMRSAGRTFSSTTQAPTARIAELPGPSRGAAFFHPDFRCYVEGDDRMGDVVLAEKVRAGLVPRREVLHRVERLRRRIRWPAVGVHVREGDFAGKYGTRLPGPAAFDAAIAAVRERYPGRSVFCVSDGAASTRVDVAIRPEVNRRDTVEGVREALAHMLLLSQSELIIGTPLSSFNAFAAWWGRVPLVWLAEDWAEALPRAAGWTRDRDPVLLNDTARVCRQFGE